MIGPQGRVTVVGAGVAGVSTVAALRSRGHAGPVVLLDVGQVPHDRPPLSKAYLLGAAEDDVRTYPPAWFDDHGVDLRTGVRAVGLDAATGTVTLTGGELIDADAVVLAEGGAAHVPDLPGIGLARTLRTLDDARALRALLVPGARLVVLGAGLIGSEVAATALALGVAVTLVDPDPLPLAPSVGDDVARVLHADHARHGVCVVPDAVVELLGGTAGVSGVQLAGGEVLPADVVLLATGMRCVDDLARAGGLDVSGRPGGVLVDDRQRTSAARVLAVGDGTRRRARDGSAAATAGHWEAARLDGGSAAATLLGHDTPPRGASWFWSDRHGRHLEVVGDGGAGGDGGAVRVRRGTLGPGPFAVLVHQDGVVIGAVTVDDPRTARAARRLVDRRVQVEVAVLADPTTDLRSLLRG